MPTVLKHMETSLRRSGKDYRRLHEWIDDPEKRGERHDLTRIVEFSREIASEHGEEEAREYLRHLSDDYNSSCGHTMEKTQELIEKTLNEIGSFV